VTIERVSTYEPLTNEECRSLAPARAKRLAYSLAGRVRYLFELATGAPAYTDGASTPLNPQGQLGIDRSGPPWGDAHTHPVWVYAVTAPIGSGVYPAVTSQYRHLVELDGGVGHTVRLVARWRCRPHFEGSLSPYSRAYLRGVVTRKGASGTATVTVRVYGPEGPGGPSMDATASTTSSTTLSTGAYTPVRPGWTERVIDVIQTSTTPSYVGPISLCQVARRSH
jgi:hypothetical protein